MKMIGPSTAEAWNGTGAYTYDRIGRGTLHIRAACLSVLGGLQPGPLERYLREVFGGRGDDGLLQRFQLTVWPDGAGPWRHVDRWPDAAARARVVEIFQRLNTLDPAAVGAEELTPEERPFLRFEAEAQELFDGWRTDLEHRLRGGGDHPLRLSHLAKYRSLLPSLALLFHLIDGVDTGRRGPVSCAAAAQAAAWCEYLAAHARRLYGAVTDAARVAAALLATRLLPWLPAPSAPKGWLERRTPDPVAPTDPLPTEAEVAALVDRLMTIQPFDYPKGEGLRESRERFRCPPGCWPARLATRFHSIGWQWAVTLTASNPAQFKSALRSWDGLTRLGRPHRTRLPHDSRGPRERTPRAHDHQQHRPRFARPDHTCLATT